jgi:hypothetical protein
MGWRSCCCGPTDNANTPKLPGAGTSTSRVRAPRPGPCTQTRTGRSSLAGRDAHDPSSVEGRKIVRPANGARFANVEELFSFLPRQAPFRERRIHVSPLQGDALRATDQPAKDGRCVLSGWNCLGMLRLRGQSLDGRQLRHLILDPPKRLCGPAALAGRKPLAVVGRRIQKVHDLGSRNGPLTRGSAGV